MYLSTKDIKLVDVNTGLQLAQDSIQILNGTDFYCDRF